MQRKILLILFSTALVSGCGALVPVHTLDKTGIDAMMAASKLPTVGEGDAKNMTVIGEVAGYSCMNKLYESSATKVGAMDQAKMVAVQRGATAVSAMVCTEGGLSFVRNCWQSWECKANALK